MLLTILLLNLLLRLTDATPKAGFEASFEDLVEKLELISKDMETRMQDEKEIQAAEKKEL